MRKLTLSLLEDFIVFRQIMAQCTASGIVITSEKIPLIDASDMRRRTKSIVAGLSLDNFSLTLLMPQFELDRNKTKTQNPRYSARGKNNFDILNHHDLGYK